MTKYSIRKTSRRSGTGADRDLVVLKKSEAACLEALRDDIERKTQIAIATKLDLLKTSTALERLKSLGLAIQDEQKRWHPTKHGRSSSFKTFPDRMRRGSDKPGRGGERLLSALGRPMRGEELAVRLGVTAQRIRQLVVKLHAREYVRFGDENKPFHIIARCDDPTVLLSWHEERVLSVIPREFATNPTKIRLAAGVSGELMKDALTRLLAEGFIGKTQGPRGDTLYQMTAAGVTHPQRRASPSCAAPPRLPVESDRVLAVLSHISDAGKLRIRDISGLLGIPLQSINALFQYLKRKSLVRKVGQKLQAPYELTEEGRQALAGMIRLRAA